MAFNHYAKIKRILEQEQLGWVIKRIDEPTSAKNFKGETKKFDHYYRIYSANNTAIKYCKFQQLELLSKSLNTPIELLPIVT
jgi:hypothetical protein